MIIPGKFGFSRQSLRRVGMIHRSVDIAGRMYSYILFNKCITLVENLQFERIQIA